jgi:hypothetical protein
MGYGKNKKLEGLAEETRKPQGAGISVSYSYLLLKDSRLTITHLLSNFVSIWLVL